MEFLPCLDQLARAIKLTFQGAHEEITVDLAGRLSKSPAVAPLQVRHHRQRQPLRVPPGLLVSSLDVDCALSARLGSGPAAPQHSGADQLASVSFQRRFSPAPYREGGQQEQPVRSTHMLHDHRFGPRTPLAAKLAAASVIGLIASGGIVAIGPASSASADVPHADPPPNDPRAASAASAGVDVPSPQPPTPATVVISGTGTGDGPGPKTVVVGGPGPGDGSGPKATVMP